VAGCSRANPGLVNGVCVHFDIQSGGAAMTKPELGTKRLCASCGARFYDLLHSPITCPKCGTVFAVTPALAQTRLKATPEPERTFEPAVETPGAQFVSPVGADAETDSEQTSVILEEKDDDELADEDLNGAALLEEGDQDEDDVVEVIIEEEN
jgi:uncharacterized protein (TIGR02300 family)